MKKLSIKSMILIVFLAVMTLGTIGCSKSKSTKIEPGVTNTYIAVPGNQSYSDGFSDYLPYYNINAKTNVIGYSTEKLTNTFGEPAYTIYKETATTSESSQNEAFLYVMPNKNENSAHDEAIIFILKSGVVGSYKIVPFQYMNKSLITNMFKENFGVGS